MTRTEEEIVRNMMIRMGETMDRAMEEMRKDFTRARDAAVAEEREACARMVEEGADPDSLLARIGADIRSRT